MSGHLFSVFGQVKIKERRKVVCIVLRDKEGNEKKRKKLRVTEIEKYNLQGQKTEEIEYGERDSFYDSTGLSCGKNYQNIKSSTRFSYDQNILISDSTWYFKDNKVNYLHSTTKYYYDEKQNLMQKETFNRRNEISYNELFEYGSNSLVTKKRKIEFFSYSSGVRSDTVTTEFSHDNKDRLTKEESKTRNSGWKREYSYIDKNREECKYYYTHYQDKYPDIFELTELNERGDPVKIMSIGLSSDTPTETTEITYDEYGLIKTTIEIPEYTRCDVNEFRTLFLYEYDYY
jgi:hypothetical protein